MKAFLKILALCVVLSMVMTVFSACAPTEEEVAGFYTGSYTYQGNEIYVEIELAEDGTYSKTVEKNGVLYSRQSGEYEIEGRDVLMYDPDSLTYHGSWTRYKYSKGKLENNGHKFFRQ